MICRGNIEPVVDRNASIMHKFIDFVKQNVNIEICEIFSVLLNSIM